MSSRATRAAILVAVTAVGAAVGGAAARAQPKDSSASPPAPTGGTTTSGGPADAPPAPTPLPPPHLAPQPQQPPKMVRMVDGKTPVIDAPISDVSVVSTGAGGGQHYVQIATRLAQRAFFCRVVAQSRGEAEQIRANILSPTTQWVYCRGRTSTRDGDPRFFVHLELKLSSMADGHEFIVMGRP